MDLTALAPVLIDRLLMLEERAARRTETDAPSLARISVRHASQPGKTRKLNPTSAYPQSIAHHPWNNLLNGMNLGSMRPATGVGFAVLQSICRQSSLHFGRGRGPSASSSSPANSGEISSDSKNQPKPKRSQRTPAPIPTTAADANHRITIIISLM
jgi:hypothetical protein